VDFRYPTVRLRKFADFFLTRYIRCTCFGGPTKFKTILENHAPFLLLQALSNEFGKLVSRVRRVWHVLGGDDPGLYFSKEHTGINRGSSAKKCRNGDDGLNALESTRQVFYSLLGVTIRTVMKCGCAFAQASANA
jgi:hypothetical protein